MAFDIPPYFQEKFLSRFISMSVKQWMAVSLAFVGGLALLIVYFQPGSDPLSYAQGEEAFAKWEACPEDKSLFEAVESAFKKIPALEEKYRGELAQALLNKKRFDEALKMVQKPLSLLKEEAPYHASFGETTLLIEQKAFQKALESAVSLKERMERELDIDRLRTHSPLLGGALLYAQNLLRIASLQKGLENKPGEKAAWDEFEDFLERGGAVKDLLYRNFKENQVDLFTYIKERRRDL